MNKVLILMKSTFKQILAGLPIMLLIYVVFPSALVFFLGGAFNKIDGQEIEKIKLMVLDEDKTVASENLMNFFESTQINEYIEINSEKQDQVLKIPKGYEVALKNGKDFNIDLTTNTKQSEITIENILNNYHKNIILKKEGIKQEEINLIINGGIITDITINEKKNANIGILAASFISTIIVMFLSSYTGQRCLDYSKNLTLRENSTPNSKYSLLFYGLITQCAFVGSMMAIYIIIFRVTDNAFTGNLGLIIMMSVISSIFGFIFAILITVFTPPKLGMIVGMGIMLITLVSGFNVPTFSALSEINPFKIINDMFIAYERHGSFEVIKANLIQMISIIGVMGLAITIRIKGKRVID